jgi:hypothetical protein
MTAHYPILTSQCNPVLSNVQLRPLLPSTSKADKSPRPAASAKTAAGRAEVVTLLAGMTAENWAAHRDRALAILRG